MAALAMFVAGCDYDHAASPSPAGSPSPKATLREHFQQALGKLEGLEHSPPEDLAKALQQFGDDISRMRFPRRVEGDVRALITDTIRFADTARNLQPCWDYPYKSGCSLLVSDFNRTQSDWRSAVALLLRDL